MNRNKSRCAFVLCIALITLAIGAFALSGCKSETDDGKKECVHRWTDEWESNGTSHFHTCLLCDKKKDVYHCDFHNSLCNVCGNSTVYGDAAIITEYDEYFGAVPEPGYLFRLTDKFEGEYFEFPSEFAGKPIYQISSTSKKLKKFKIPDSVKVFENAGFKNCTSLTEVDIPATIDALPAELFFGCTALSKVVLHDGLKTIGGMAFGRCTALRQITVPRSVKEMRETVFYECTALSEMVIPDSVETLRGGTFIGCTALEKAEIYGKGDHLTLSSTFRDCRSLTEVILTDNVAILAGTFQNCSSLKNVVIPDSVTELRSSVFQNCSSLKNVVIPDSVTEIGDNAFHKCAKLTSVKLPADIQTVESMAFAESGLTDLTVSESSANTLTYAANSCVSDTPWYDDQPDGPVYLGKVLIDIKGTPADGTFIDYIRDDTVALGFRSTANLNNYKGVIGFIIPPSVKYIWDGNLLYNNVTSMVLPGTVECIFLSSFTVGTTVYTDAQPIPPLWFLYHPAHIRFGNNTYMFYGCTLSDDKSYVVSITKSGDCIQKNPQHNIAELQIPKAPLRKGYVFVGWAVTPNGNAEYYMETLADAPDGTLYAVWEKVE